MSHALKLYFKMRDEKSNIGIAEVRDDNENKMLQGL